MKVHPEMLLKTNGDENRISGDDPPSPKSELKSVWRFPASFLLLASALKK
jgi:hypothetical protein